MINWALKIKSIAMIKKIRLEEIIKTDESVLAQWATNTSDGKSF